MRVRILGIKLQSILVSLNGFVILGQSVVNIALRLKGFRLVDVGKNWSRRFSPRRRALTRRSPIIRGKPRYFSWSRDRFALFDNRQAGPAYQVAHSLWTFKDYCRATHNVLTLECAAATCNVLRRKRDNESPRQREND